MNPQKEVKFLNKNALAALVLFVPLIFLIFLVPVFGNIVGLFAGIIIANFSFKALKDKENKMPEGGEFLSFVMLVASVGIIAYSAFIFIGAAFI
jgi:hypothetical protein